MAKKKARFSHLFCHKVFTKDIKHEYKSFIFLSRKCAGQFVVNCEYHVYRYCYIFKLSKTNSIERLICLAVLPKKNCYGQASIRENSATMSKMIHLENFADMFNLLAERINPLFASFVIYSNCLDFGNERKEVHQEPMIRNMQLPY